MSKQTRYGIGEWYGKLFWGLDIATRIKYAKRGKKMRPALLCPFRPGATCNKAGGVCSLFPYEKDGTNVEPLTGGDLVSLCPSRFWEGNTVYHKISEVILGVPSADVVKEVGFLKRVSNSGEEEDEAAVGRIDTVLATAKGDQLLWCAVELQAVYFSGKKMEDEYPSIASTAKDNRLPFPTQNRRPDFRSSGPKRLMPQLQIKVPTLRRWGKKMAVVVDKCFFHALGPMTPAKHLANSDIVWFVVDFKRNGDHADLFVSEVVFTTLESAVEGLTAGRPVSLDEFESEIRRRLGHP